MSQFVFGAGTLWGIPTADATGTAIVNPTPVLFGTLQDVAVDISFETKELFGQLQFAEAVGRGKGKVTGKAKMARLNGTLINSLFFGQTLNAGVIATVFDTAGVTVATTVTPTVPSSGTWSKDLGVRSSAGIPLKRVASAPATGQYSVTAGAYTFASADVGTTVFIDYEYTATSTTAQNSVVMNLPMGYAPTFQAEFSIPYQGKNFVIKLENCIASKLGFATKLDDFMIPEFDFSCFASSNGKVLTYALTDA